MAKLTAHGSRGQKGENKMLKRYLIITLVSALFLLPIMHVNAEENPYAYSEADFGIALKADGTLWVWGTNLYGRLGINSYDMKEFVETPVKIMDNIASFSCSSDTVAAVTTDGSLYMWGDNTYGQLAIGEQFLLSAKPAKIMDDVRSVYIIHRCTFAIKKDSSLWAWGYNYGGELGIGTSRYNEHLPQKVLDNVKSVFHGYGCNFAVKEDGSLWGWGYNYSGELGNKTESEISLKPVKVMDNVAAGTAGNGFVLILKDDNSLWGVGRNHWSTLGNNAQINYDYGGEALQTEYIKILDDVIDFAAGDDFAMAIKKDGSLWLWGETRFLFERTGEPQYGVPTKIKDNMDSIVAERTAGFAIDRNGSLILVVHDFKPATKLADNVASFTMSNYAVLFIKKDGSLWQTKIHLDFETNKILDGMAVQ